MYMISNTFHLNAEMSTTHFNSLSLNWVLSPWLRVFSLHVLWLWRGDWARETLWAEVRGWHGRTFSRIQPRQQGNTCLIQCTAYKFYYLWFRRNQQGSFCRFMRILFAARLKTWHCGILPSCQPPLRDHPVAEAPRSSDHTSTLTHVVPFSSCQGRYL